MEKIKVNEKVKYTGKPNRWTFHDDLVENSRGIVMSVNNADEDIIYLVKFDNGITTTLGGEDLEVVI